MKKLSKRFKCIEKCKYNYYEAVKYEYKSTAKEETKGGTRIVEKRENEGKREGERDDIMERRSL
jgi:hypothetical protein